MSLPQDKKTKIYTLGNWSGGVNKNDPRSSIGDDQLYDCLNVVLNKKGVKRWCGCKGVTAKDAIDDYLRGMYYSYEIDGTAHLLAMWGGNCYEIDPSDGTIGASIYATGGTGELWGATHWGKFYGCDGTKVFKVVDGVGYQVGISPPVAGTSAAAAGGSLPPGVYKIMIGYALKNSGLNVLYSQGFALGNVTLSGGNGTIAISNFANSSDPQVNNKVVWMTLAGGTTYYFFYETNNNTSTSFNITSDSAYQNAIVYEQFALPSGLSVAFTSMIIADNRIIGILGNRAYFSMKSTNGFDIERFPALNYIDYPYQLNGLFSIGNYVYFNTVDNGIIIQSLDDIGSKFEHKEKRLSFKFMRTVVNWKGGKFGFTGDGLQFFNGETFEEFDYSINIRPVIKNMYSTADSNFQPYACLVSRDNRLEYHLSFRDTSIGSLNNNRTYVLNLSQTVYQDNINFKTPWEIIDRGFNYAACSSTGQWYFGQSYIGSSTIFKELTTHTTQQGFYDGSGIYLTEATNMNFVIVGKTMFENLFSKVIFEQIRMLIQCNEIQRLGIVIADTVEMESIHDVVSTEQLDWDVDWDVDWIAEKPFLAIAKIKDGTFGYSWYFKHDNTSDDINFEMSSIQILSTIETGRQT